MSWRCFVSDYDLLNLLKELRRTGYFCLPTSPPGTDGTLADAGLLTCPSQNFRAGWNGVSADAVPIGTVVNLIGEGFCYVTAVGATVQTQTQITVAVDANRQGVVDALVPGAGKRYVIGGFSDVIRVCYEEMYRSVGVKQNPQTGAFIYRASEVPSTWHGADTALIYEALHKVLLSTMNWRDGVYDYWLNYSRERAAQLRDNIQWAFDVDGDETADIVQPAGQTRLVR